MQINHQSSIIGLGLRQLPRLGVALGVLAQAQARDFATVLYNIYNRQNSMYV